MRWRTVRVIALREFLTTVRRREFLLVTFGLPLLYFVLGAGTLAITNRAVGEARDREASRAHLVIWRDPSGLLDRDTLRRGEDDIAGDVVVSEDDGRTAVRTGAARLFVDIDPGFLKNGQVTVYLPERHEIGRAHV